MMNVSTEISTDQARAKRFHLAATRRTWLISLGSVLAIVVLALIVVAWLGHKASIIKTELESASQILPELKSDIVHHDGAAVAGAVERLIRHTTAAREAASDPLWTMAGGLPWVGANFQAAEEITVSADDLAQLGAAPLAEVIQSVDWKTLVPTGGGMDLQPLIAAEPRLASAAHAVRTSADRLKNVETDGLLGEVADSLRQVNQKLETVRSSLDAAANAAAVAPKMLGAASPRNYLLLIENNAETRASGGIPGAIATLTVDHGKLTLGSQTTAAGMGVFVPPVPVDAEQQQIYSGRLGKYMQDVNLTPDFPTSAATARAMWEQKYGQRLDGVISMDPVALGYLLDATGPVQISSPEMLSLAKGTLPTELTSKNIVKTLLSDVYAHISEPKLQDAYFAGVAQEAFSALSAGKGDAAGLMDGVIQGTAEGRIHLWSSLVEEQAVIAKYSVSGSISGPSVSPAQFGVYFNDGTGAKMDYYVKRTVQLVEECTGDDYGQVKVRITSTNTAPANAATSLPAYVTGGGAFGVPEGAVQTNVVAYGPAQANVESAMLDGKKTDFAAHRHSNRPVGSVTVNLAPGQSSTVELTFGKIVQHTEPNVVVTPTVQPVKDVVMATETAACVPGK